MTKPTGGWYTYPSEKYEFVSWDDEIPNIWKNKIHVPHHQTEESFTNWKPIVLIHLHRSEVTQVLGVMIIHDDGP